MKRRTRARKHKAPGLPKGKIGKPLELICKLSMCDPHYIEELTSVWEQDEQKWAKLMKEFLEDLNAVIVDTGGTLNTIRGKKYRSQYRKLLKRGRIASLEPAQILYRNKGKKRKKSRPQDLLNRLNEYEDHLFMFVEVTP